MHASCHGFPIPRVRRHWIALACGLGIVLCALSLPADAVVGSRLDRGSPDRQLSAADVGRYRNIFALQVDGGWEEADRLIGQLENELLLGHVLAQRYLHPTRYRSRYKELASWLEQYADHPDADRLYRLALKRKPGNAASPRRPTSGEDSLAAEPPLDSVHPYWSKKKLTNAERRQVQRLKRQIRRNLRRIYLTKTERLLEQPKVRRLFDRFELDEAYSQVAAAWLYYGKADKAFRLADEVAGRSGGALPISHWTAGQAAWRLGRTGTAARHFEQLASSEIASSWNRSAGAYWAARAHQRAPDLAEAHRWLTVAAGFPSTFYGLLAKRRLNLNLEVAFQAPSLNASEMEQLRAAPEGARAVALIRVGQKDLAERELLALADWKEPGTTRGLLALTQTAGLPRLGWEISQRLLADESSGWSKEDLGAVLYPLPPWRPQGGFLLDRALIYAFMRQESSFDPRAKSPDGARGLMQLMPRTARSLDKKHQFRGRQRDLLFDPLLNMALGQRYLKQLLGSRRVDRDLLRLTVAYNAGPGNLGKWERQMDYDGDPLLFIESLPTLETRLFAERVLTNLWIYRLRLGQPTPSLSALASDQWPAYEAWDDASHQIASRPKTTSR
jgi:soluble lytic murein transglycosylase-like protein